MAQDHLRRPLAHIAGHDCFTGREPPTTAFLALADAPVGLPLPALVIHGAAGIGKTTLLRHLCALLRRRRPPLPCALVDLDAIPDPLQACREALLSLRAELGRTFGIGFARFDLCLTVMLARDGGEPPPLVRANPMLSDTLQFTCEIHRAVMAGQASPEQVEKCAEQLIRGREVQSPGFRGRLARSGGADEVLRLEGSAEEDDAFLQRELMRCFAADLRAHLPGRAGKACRGVLFLDALDALHVGGSAAQPDVPDGPDAWARELAAACPDAGVLLVVAGRDAPAWEADGVECRPYLLAGLSATDGQLFLSRCGVGHAPEDGEPSPLQQAILQCCHRGPSGAMPDCHPFFLALCAEAVLSRRERDGEDPDPDAFTEIPAEHLADGLADVLLKSLPNEPMAPWIEEMALTPRFDERYAVALDRARDHGSGPSGWQRLAGFSFVQPQPGGFYRMHPLMRDALRARVDVGRARELHQWSRAHWGERGETSLAWYHDWLLDPEGALARWGATQDAAVEEERLAEAQALFAWWGDTALDEADRQAVGSGPWAAAHYGIAYALWQAPVTARGAALGPVIEHCRAALRGYSEAHSPAEWARVQSTLAMAYRALPGGNHGENVRRAIECYEAALRVYTEEGFPERWELVSESLANARADLREHEDDGAGRGAQ